MDSPCLDNKNDPGTAALLAGILEELKVIRERLVQQDKRLVHNRAQSDGTDVEFASGPVL